MAEHLDDFMYLGMARRYTNYILALCPFHDDSKPSLLVFEDGRYNCLGCLKTGTWSELEGVSGGSSEGAGVTVLSPVLSGPKIPNDHEVFVEMANKTLVEFPDMGKYLKDRKVDSMVKTAKLGWWDGWIVIPVFSRMRELQGLILRSTPLQQEHTGIRYWGPAGQEALMYVPDWKLWKESDYGVICFGMIDAIALASVGIPAVTTTGGMRSFDAKWLEKERRPLLIMPDRDEEWVAKKLANDLGWRGKVVKIEYTDELKDPADLVRAGKTHYIKGLL